MATMSDLDDMLSDDEPEVTTEEVQEEKPAEEATAEPPEQEAEQEAEPAPDKEAGLHAALTEAREQTRALKDRLERLEQATRQPVAPQQRVERQALPDPLEDNIGFTASLEQRLAQMEANTIASISERAARVQHGGEFVDEAFQAAQAQGLVDRFKGSQDPWGDLARWHKDQTDLNKLREIGDVEAFKKKVREEAMAEAMAEIKAQQVAESVSRGGGASLASEPNLGSRKAPAWTGPSSLDDILGG